MPRNIVDQSRIGPRVGACSSSASTVSPQPITLYKYIIYRESGWGDGELPTGPAAGHCTGAGAIVRGCGGGRTAEGYPAAVPGAGTLSATMALAQIGCWRLSTGT